MNQVMAHDGPFDFAALRYLIGAARFDRVELGLHRRSNL